MTILVMPRKHPLFHNTRGPDQSGFTRSRTTLDAILDVDRVYEHRPKSLYPHHVTTLQYSILQYYNILKY